MATVRDFQVNNGLEVNANANVVGNTVASDFLVNITGAANPPTAVFDFTKGVDPRITFTRSSNASYRAANGTIVYAGVNVPRINYDSNGVCQGLLCEQPSTNDFTLSTNIGNTATGLWYVSGGDATAQAVTFNAITAPDGSNTATLFYHATANVTYKTLGTNFGVVTNRIYTHSVFVKGAGEPYTNFLHFDGGDGLNVLSFTYYFSNNTFSAVSAGSSNCAVIGTPRSEPYANGWYRISYSYHYTGGAASRYVTHKMDLDYGAAVIGRGFYVWGAQHEWNDKPTSFIPTTTSAATRGWDFASCTDSPSGNNLSSWFNQNQGTFLIEWNVPVTGPSTVTQYSGYPGPIVIWRPEDATNVIGHIFYNDATSGKTPAYETFNNNVNLGYMQASTGVANGVFYKSAFGYAANGHIWNHNGENTQSLVPTSQTTLATKVEFGRSRANGLQGHVRRVKYWSYRQANTNIYNATL